MSKFIYTHTLQEKVILDGMFEEILKNSPIFLQAMWADSKLNSN